MAEIMTNPVATYAMGFVIGVLLALVLEWS